MKLLRDHILEEDVHGDTIFIRQNYLLMLVGAHGSPMGARREVTPDDYAALGQWQSVSALPSQSGHYLMNGSYENDDGLLPDAVLFGWFDTQHAEFEVCDGWFPEVRAWMDVPWLPDVWDAAKNLFYRQKRSFSK